MHYELLEAVTGLGNPTIAVIGDLMLDVYVFGQVERISPEAPIPVLVQQRIETRPGGAASVAIDVAALGAKCICMGVVSDDDEGRRLVGLLQSAGIATDCLVTSTDRPTTTKTRVIGVARGCLQQQLLRLDRQSSQAIDQGTIGRILRSVGNILDRVQAICLSDYGYGVLVDELAGQIIQMARDHDIPVLVDPTPKANWPARYRQATCLVPNRFEAGAFAGKAIKNIQDCQEIAGTLIRRLDLEAAVIKLDADGAYLQQASAPSGQHIPARARSVFDVTGAGDQVLATLAVARASGFDWHKATQLATIAAGIEVTKFGACPVTIDDIIREIIHSQSSGLPMEGGSFGLPIAVCKGIGPEKVLPLGRLLKELDWRRRIGLKVVFTNGCFDILHRGHIEYLGFCRQQGDLLVVGLNSDRSVRQIKGPDRPINTQQDRAALLAALASVDFVTIFDEPTPMALIEQIRPDVLVKGRDWQEKGVVGAEFVRSYGGKVVFAPLLEGRSTTATIEQIKTGARRS